MSLILSRESTKYCTNWRGSSTNISPAYNLLKLLDVLKLTDLHIIKPFISEFFSAIYMTVKFFYVISLV